MRALTVRRKLQLGVFAIVLGILAASLFATSASVNKQEADPSEVLRDYASQFDHFRRTEAAAMYTGISVASDDSEVEAAISKADFGAAQRGFFRIADDLRGALDLDLAVLVGADGKVIAERAPPGIAGLVKDTRSFHDALQDVSVKDGIEYLGGEPYQVSAEPFYAIGGQQNAKTTTGVLMIGRKLSQLVREFGDEHNTSGLVLAIARDGRVSSATIPNSQYREVESLIANKGGSYFVAPWAGVPQDVVLRSIDACNGACARVAQIIVVRSRGAIEAEKRKRMLETTAWLVGIALAALGGGWLLARWITKPIEGYVEATEALAKGGGDLTQRLDADSDDELGRLAHNLNEVFEQIGNLASQVKERASEVASSSEEIRGASRAVLDGAAEQASRLQSTGAATTEMSASIQQVATSAADANAIAQRSGQAIEDAVARMEQIREAVEGAAQRMALLGETNKRIGSIVDTIHQIADQTSLLALNAAIEAAHAGEHGRGFTVVADAVGQLATRVDRSAKEIDELIGHSRAQTEEALEAMGAGKREVELGTKLIGDSIAGIQKVLHVFEDTTSAVKEQAIASDEIARNMEAVGRIAQDVLVASRQAVAQGERLTEIASSLEDAVSGFRVEGEAPTSRRIAGREPPKLLGNG
jgi:methyl-accepting chemotaxis protein